MFGEYVRRPTAEYVTRLTECWQMSQPLYLRHLSIIRDTILKGKGSIYNYYTYENFDKLVEKGIGFWEAVVTVPDDMTAGLNFAASLDAAPELDNFGFPLIDSSLFCGPDNTAILGECTSALKIDRFSIERKGPILQGRADGTHGNMIDLASSSYADCSQGRQTSRPKATSRKPKPSDRSMAVSPIMPIAARKSATALPRPERPKHMGVGVKARGRPRIYPKAGAPIDIDNMDIHAVKRLNDSQEMAEKYARSKIEKEISWRIAEGRDAALVAHEALEEVEVIRKEAGQDPLLNYTRGMILHIFAGGPAPPPLKKISPRIGQPTRAPYRPSIAAHTILVPDPRRKLILGSKEPPKPDRRAENSLKRTRRPPAHLLESEDEAGILSVSRKRVRGNAKADNAAVPYWPSIAAHSWPLITPPFPALSAPQGKGKRQTARLPKVKGPSGSQPKGEKPSNLRFRYLPSMSAHSGSFLPRLPSKRKRATRVTVQHSLASRPASPQDVTQFRYLPSMAAHSPSLLPSHAAPAVQSTYAKETQQASSQYGESLTNPTSNSTAPQTPFTVPLLDASLTTLGLHSGPYPEGLYPGWVKYMLKYYEPGLTKIARSQDGVFLGKTTNRRKRNGEPVGFRPRSYKLVIFKSARLRKLTWFTAQTDAQQRGPSHPTSDHNLVCSPIAADYRPSPKQDPMTPAWKPACEPSVAVPRVLPDQSTLAPSNGSLPQPWTPAGGTRVYTSPYSQPLAVGQLNSMPRTNRALALSNPNGNKRKREERNQPHRGPPPPYPFSMNSHSSLEYSAQMMQSVGSGDTPRAPHHFEGDLPPAPEIMHSHITDITPFPTAEGSSHGASQVYPAPEKAISSSEQDLPMVVETQSPTAEDSQISLRSPSDFPTVDRTFPLNGDEETRLRHRNTAPGDIEAPVIVENSPAIVRPTQLIIEGPENAANASTSKKSIVPDDAKASETSHIATSTPSVSGRIEISDGDTAVTFEDHHWIGESSKDCSGLTIAESMRPTEIPPIPTLSIGSEERAMDGPNTPTKSLREQEINITSTLPDHNTEEEQNFNREESSFRDHKQSESHITQRKVVTGRKYFSKMNRQGGSVAMLRKKVIMDIMDKCGGVYAGHKELIKPFVIEWEKKGLGGGTPEDKTIQNTVDALRKEGKIRQIKFYFKDIKGLGLQKDMLIFPGVDVVDPRVKDVQARMIAYHPRFYWPSAAVPPDEYSVTTQKMMDGKERAQHARYAALKAEEQLAQLSNSRHDEETSTQSARADFDPVRRVPMISQISPSHMHRLDGPRPRRRGGEGNVASLAIPGEIQPPFPRPANFESNSSKELIWLPESYAFSEFNYEEKRPTVLEPTVRDDDHRRHARYGRQMDPPTATRRSTSEDLEDHRTGGKVPKVPSMAQPPAMNLWERPSLLFSDFRSGYPSALSASTPVLFPRPSLYPSSILHFRSQYAGHAASQLEQSSYRSPYTTDATWKNLAQSVENAGHEKPKNTQTQILPSPDNPKDIVFGRIATPPSLHPEMPHKGSVLTWVPIEQTHNFRPDPKKLIVNFMDALHYFHQGSGTFSVGFLGFAPPRRIEKNVGTCSKPYSYGPHTIHNGFPVQRGPRNLLPKRSPQDEDTQFEQEVDGLLRWELKTEGIQDAGFEQWPFINHVCSHIHITVEAVDAKMDKVKGVTMSSDGSRMLNRRLPSAVINRPRIGSSIPGPSTKKYSTAVAEALKRIERAPMKRRGRRLPTLVESSTPQREPLRMIGLDASGRPTKFRRIRGPRESRSLGKDEEKRLVTAVMIVRTLTGGLEERIDWELVAKVFDQSYEQSDLANRWPYIRSKWKMALPKMESDFQDMFAEAYDEGSVPVLDFDNLVDYDWKWLTQWTLGSLGTSTQTEPDLPAERANFEELYSLKINPEIDINDYYEINGPTSKLTADKRVGIMASKSYVRSMDKAAMAPKEKDQSGIAKSWVRANVMTPEINFQMELADAKLRSLPDHVAEDALKQLLSTKLLVQENKGRPMPGRNFDLSDHFHLRLRKNVQPVQIQEAVVFKQRLDERFAEKGSFLYPYVGTDGDTLATMNLVAHGRIRLVPINIPLNEWGQTDGSYETRLMDKTRLNFQVEMYPLPSYISGNPLEPLPAKPSQHLQDPMARIPLWYDLQGELVPNMWEVALAAVMAVLVVRPGVDAEEIEKNTTPAMEAWEIELILGWLVEAKAATKVGSGCALDEWWWLALPRRDEVITGDSNVHGGVIEIDEESSGGATVDKGKGKEQGIGG